MCDIGASADGPSSQFPAPVPSPAPARSCIADSAPLSGLEVGKRASSAMDSIRVTCFPPSPRRTLQVLPQASWLVEIVQDWWQIGNDGKKGGPGGGEGT